MKAKYGLGDMIYINFFAPLNEASPSDEIIYDHHSMPSDLDLVAQNDDMRYCMKMCLKMCDYISIVRSIEVL